MNLGGRQKAFNVGIGFWIFCRIFNLCMFFTIRADEEMTKQKFLRHLNLNIAKEGKGPL